MVKKKITRGKYTKLDKSKKYLSLTARVDAPVLLEFRRHIRSEGITFRRAVTFLLEDYLKKPIKLMRES